MRSPVPVPFVLPVLLAASLGVALAEGDQHARTPFGALVDGDGEFVPAWTGGLAEPPPEYDGPGSVHPDPFAEEEPLAVLRAGDLDRFEALLPAGLRALLEAYPETARLPVYPSHRTHAAPEWVYEATAAANAQLVDGGNGFEGAKAGIPFPRPKQALEVYWNHVARWRGLAVEARSADFIVYPNGRSVRSVRDTRIRFDYYLDDGDPNRLFSLLSRVTSPPQRAGGGVLVLETMNQDAEPRSAWSWDAGRRRALRAPLLAFDSAVDTADGLMTADDADIVNGSPSRFEWNVSGPVPMVVPYNSYGLATFDRDELILPGHIAPDATRYEVHRVWVLEARLKPEWRHVYSRRVFYVDEDSWTALLCEAWDQNGELWRVGVAHTKNFYEVPATLPVAYVFHDLRSRRYFVQGLGADPERSPLRPEPPPTSQYTPSGLRRFVR